MVRSKHNTKLGLNFIAYSHFSKAFKARYGLDGEEVTAGSIAHYYSVKADDPALQQAVDALR